MRPTPVALLAFSAACCAGRGDSGKMSSTPTTDADAPRCKEPALPWNATSRARAVEVLEASLGADDERNQLSVLRAAGEKHRSGQRIFLMLPDDVTLPPISGTERVHAPPRLQPGKDELTYWEISIVEPYGDGTMFKLEESLMFSDGRTSVVVMTLCGARVRGVPMTRYLAGFAT